MKKKLWFTLFCLTMFVVFTLTSCTESTSTDMQDVANIPVDTLETNNNTAKTTERTEWELDKIATLSDVVTGIINREYEIGEGASYKIREDITYNNDIVYTVLYNTGAVQYDVPGKYDITYWIYFNAAKLEEYADKKNISLTIPNTDKLIVSVSATLTILDSENLVVEDNTKKENTKTTESITKNNETATKTTSTTNTNSAKTTCNHNWIATKHDEEGHYEKVLVTKAYDESVFLENIYICKKCGYCAHDIHEIATHLETVCEKGAYTLKSVYETVHHDAVYENQWVVDKAAYTIYKCSKCGATKSE